MTTGNGRTRDGAGLAFGGKKAAAIKARLRELQEEQRRTGRISIFDREPAK